MHQLDWGVVSTTSVHLGGAPFGNPLSVSDGPCDTPTGRLLLYLSPMDATMQDVQRGANANASLTLHELQMPGACVGVDPEDPTCAKLTLSGAGGLGGGSGAAQRRQQPRPLTLLPAPTCRPPGAGAGRRAGRGERAAVCPTPRHAGLAQGPLLPHVRACCAAAGAVLAPCRGWFATADRHAVALCLLRTLPCLHRCPCLPPPFDPWPRGPTDTSCTS